MRNNTNRTKEDIKISSLFSYLKIFSSIKLKLTLSSINWGSVMTPIKAITDPKDNVSKRVDNNNQKTRALIEKLAFFLKDVCKDPSLTKLC